MERPSVMSEKDGRGINLLYSDTTSGNSQFVLVEALDSFLRSATRAQAVHPASLSLILGVLLANSADT